MEERDANRCPLGSAQDLLIHSSARHQSAVDEHILDAKQKQGLMLFRLKIVASLRASDAD